VNAYVCEGVYVFASVSVIVCSVPLLAYALSTLREWVLVSMCAQAYELSPVA
jgi:hypothetical protein